MAGFASESDETIAAINVTPLVDITLVLLIVFMVTATTLIRETFEVELPRAASGGETVAPTLVLALDRAGKLFLDGEETTLDGARAAVRAAAAKSKDAKAVISADKRLSHGQVVEVIDLIKSEGLAKFAINIEKSAPAGQGAPP